MKEHPTRQQLLRAVERGGDELADHLSQCDECREFYEILSAFMVTGEPRLEHAPAGWIDRAIAILESKRLADAARGLVAKLSFDSWSVTAAQGVRGPAADRRRLRFTAGDIEVDLQAVRKQRLWEFMVSISGSEATASSHLLVEQKKLMPDEDGYISWHSASPPEQLAIRSGETVIELPQLSWNNPHS